MHIEQCETCEYLDPPRCATCNSKGYLLFETYGNTEANPRARMSEELKTALQAYKG